jgi:putative ABC transport system permease protein
MFNNNIITAWRNLHREKFFSALNILGLAVALACAALIATWVWDEWRRDRYFPNADQIVRVTGRVVTEKETIVQAVTSVQVGPNMQKDYPEIAQYCRLDQNDVVAKVGNQQYAETGFLTVDSTFFSVFNYAIKGGNARTALTEPYTVVLTEKMARKYFGDQDPIGKTLDLNLYDDTGKGKTYRVTGILDGPVRPSHVQFEGLISFASFFNYNPEYLGEDGWDESGYYTYLLLQKGTKLEALQAKMPDFFQKYLQPRYGANMRLDFELQPLSDIYLHSDRRYEIAQNGSASNLYIFITVGLLILFVAGINYVNMATARAAKRARSVGVRKALGAQRAHLAAQFLTESLLTALFDLVFGRDRLPTWIGCRCLSCFCVVRLSACIGVERRPTSISRWRHESAPSLGYCPVCGIYCADYQRIGSTRSNGFYTK